MEDRLTVTLAALAFLLILVGCGAAQPAVIAPAVTLDPCGQIVTTIRVEGAPVPGTPYLQDVDARIYRPCDRPTTPTPEE